MLPGFFTMHTKDLYSGLVLFCLGGWIAWEASDFPALAGMPYGAGLFPTIAAGGMCVCGALIFFSGLLALRRKNDSRDEAGTGNGSTRGMLNSLAVIVAVVLYALFLDTFGFHAVSFVALFALLCILGSRWWVSLALALFVTVIVHYIFYSLLHVPLPWGLLEPFAW